MKANRQSVSRAVEQPDEKVRFYLFHGPDEAQSRSLAQRLLTALGASKAPVASGTIKNDPAALVDEAGAMSLFGGKRLVWIEPATKDIEEGVAALLEAPATENPVVAIAGALPKTSALLKMAEAAPQAVAFAAYVPEGQDAERMVVELGRSFGLKIPGPMAMRIADSCSNDQALVSQELQKLALYLDASPHAPKELDHDAIDEIGMDSSEGDMLRLADLALSGDVGGLAGELARMPAVEPIPIVRSLQRRMLMLAPARARVERGDSPDAVMTSLGRALFFKDKTMFRTMLSNWDSERLARVADRAGRLERSLMFSPAPQQDALGEELLAIAREARRR